MIIALSGFVLTLNGMVRIGIDHGDSWTRRTVLMAAATGTTMLSTFNNKKLTGMTLVDGVATSDSLRNIGIGELHI